MESTSMCRCCATEGSFKDIKNPYYWMGEEEVYGDMLRECFDVKLTSVEQGGICEVCITQLRNASNFKKQVLNTEEQFKKHLNDIKFKATIVKEEVSADEDNDKFDSDDNPNHDDDDEDYVPEFEIPIKTETIEAKPKKRASTAKATTSRAKKTKTKKEEDSKSEPTDRAKILTRKRQKKDTLQKIVAYSNATPVLKCKGMFYYCSYCDERFLNPEKLKFHSLESHQNDFKKLNCLAGEYIIKIDVTDLTCKLCCVFLSSIQELIKHLTDEHEIKFEPIDFTKFLIPFKFNGMFRCGIDNCDASFNTYQGVIKHMNTHLANYVCEVCNNAYSTKMGLMLHVKSHTEGKPKKTPRVKRIKCPHCDFVSKHSHGHAIHMKEMHGLSTNFKCTSCDREFKNSMHLRVHVKRDHLMERNHKCPFCEKSFFYRTKLNNHLTTHTGERRFQCHICDKRFKTKYNLTIHNRIHTNDKRYKCRVCGKAYAQRSWVNAHIKSKHSEVETLDEFCVEEDLQC